MALTKTTVATNNISVLSDLPNLTDGLTAAQLKAKYDKYGVDTNTYINSVLTAELDANFATKAEVAGIVAGQILPNTITPEMLTFDPTEQPELDAHIVDYVKHPAYGASGGSLNAYTFDAMVATEYVDGMGVYLDNVIATNTATSTLNWSSLGVKLILDSKGLALTAGKMPLNCIIGLRYNASANAGAGAFQLLGEGSDVLTGNMTAGDLALGKTGYSNDPLIKITGTAPVISFSVGETLILQSDSQVTEGTGGTPVKKKEIKVNYSGTYRVRFDIKGADAGNVSGRIYKNGVAVGTLRTVSSTTYVTYTEDIAFSANDLVQIYAYSNGGDPFVYIQNFRLYVTTTPSLGTVNL